MVVKFMKSIVLPSALVFGSGYFFINKNYIEKIFKVKEIENTKDQEDKKIELELFTDRPYGLWNTAAKQTSYYRNVQKHLGKSTYETIGELLRRENSKLSEN
eukprot:gene2609-3569_t